MKNFLAVFKKENIRNIFAGWSVGDVFVLAGMIAMFSPTFYRLIKYGWGNADYTHAYFILPISLWLIWEARLRLSQRFSVNKGGACLFVIAILIYIYAGLNDFMFLDALSFFIMMWAIFKVRFTDESVKKITFPLSYLIFLVPPPGLAIDAITLPLKTLSTYGSYLCLKLFQLPVDVHGSILKVGETELFIADACSGFRSFFTLLALGAIYAYIQKTTTTKKWIIFLLVIPIAICGNVLRITLTGMISHFIGQKYAEGFFHEFSGLVLFVFTTVALIIVTEMTIKRGRNV